MYHPVEKLPRAGICSRCPPGFRLVFQLVEDPAQNPFRSCAHESSYDFRPCVLILYGIPVFGKAYDMRGLADLLVEVGEVLVDGLQPRSGRRRVVLGGLLCCQLCIYP